MLLQVFICATHKELKTTDSFKEKSYHHQDSFSPPNAPFMELFIKFLFPRIYCRKQAELVEQKQVT